MCDVATAGLALTAASTAYTMQQQRQAASAAASAQNDAAANASRARQQEQLRQDELRRRRQEVADADLEKTGATGTADRLAEATAAREDAVNEVPLTVGEGVPQVFTSESPVVGGAITSQVAKALTDARGRLAARARLSAYDDVAADEARMRTLSKSAFEALQSMSQGSLGAYGSEAAIRPGTVTPGDNIGPAGVLIGSAIASNPNTVKSWFTGETRPTDQLASRLTDRLGTVLAARTPAPAPANNTPAGFG